MHAGGSPEVVARRGPRTPTAVSLGKPALSLEATVGLSTPTCVELSHPSCEGDLR
jgi:hypothetical protein